MKWQIDFDIDYINWEYKGLKNDHNEVSWYFLVYIFSAVVKKTLVLFWLLIPFLIIFYC